MTCILKKTNKLINLSKISEVNSRLVLEKKLSQIKLNIQITSVIIYFIKPYIGLELKPNEIEKSQVIIHENLLKAVLIHFKGDVFPDNEKNDKYLSCDQMEINDVQE